MTHHCSQCSQLYMFRLPVLPIPLLRFPPCLSALTLSLVLGMFFFLYSSVVLTEVRVQQAVQSVQIKVNNYLIA
jgi:hypothetical protein